MKDVIDDFDPATKAIRSEPFTVLAFRSIVLLFFLYIALELSPYTHTDGDTECGAGSTFVTVLGGTIKSCLDSEIYLMTYASIFGALGAYVFEVRAAIVNKNRRTHQGPSASFYVLSLCIHLVFGALAAVILYIFIRAGLFTSAAHAEAVNPTGLGMFSFLVGYTSPLAFSELLNRISQDDARYDKVLNVAYEVSERVENIDKRLNDFQTSPPLDSFRGSVQILIKSKDGIECELEDGRYPVNAKNALIINAKMQNWLEDDQSDRNTDPLYIDGDDKSSFVTFIGRVDADPISCSPKREEFVFSAARKDNVQRIFRLDFQQIENGFDELDVFFELTQKGQLVYLHRIPLRLVFYGE